MVRIVDFYFYRPHYLTFEEVHYSDMTAMNPYKVRGKLHLCGSFYF